MVAFFGESGCLLTGCDPGQVGGSLTHKVIVKADRMIVVATVCRDGCARRSPKCLTCLGISTMWSYRWENLREVICLRSGIPRESITLSTSYIVCTMALLSVVVLHLFPLYRFVVIGLCIIWTPHFIKKTLRSLSGDDFTQREDSWIESGD